MRILKSLLSAFSADAKGSCGKRLSLRSFTSCGEAQVKPRGCPSLIWSSISPINGQITSIRLFGYSPSQIFLKFFCSGFLFDRCGKQLKKKQLLPKLVGITAKTSLPSSKQFSAIFGTRFFSKLKLELIKSSTVAP